jgi:hypothetical protein
LDNQDRYYRLGKAWRENNKEKISQYTKRKPTYSSFSANKKIALHLRDRLKKIIANIRIGKKRAQPKWLGCTSTELLRHIEKQWQHGMSWGNYAIDGWHLDHIKPLCSFDLTKESEQQKAFHYTNIQPLWATEHRKKSIIDRALCIW